MTAKATDNALHPNSSVSIPVQATTLIPVMKPVINTDVAGKAFSSPVIDITSTPNTRVELLDKNNNVIGRGITGSNGHVNITPDHYLSRVISQRKHMIKLMKLIMQHLIQDTLQIQHHLENQ